MKYNIKKQGKYYYLRTRIKDEVTGRYHDLYSKLPSDYESMSQKAKNRAENNAMKEIDAKAMAFASPSSIKERKQKKEQESSALSTIEKPVVADAMSNPDFTVEDLIEALKKSQWQDVLDGKYKASTYDNFESQCNSILSFPIAAIKLCELTPDDILTFLVDRINGKGTYKTTGGRIKPASKATLQQDSKILAKALRLAESHGILSKTEYKLYGKRSWKYIIFDIFSRTSVDNLMQREATNNPRVKQLNKDTNRPLTIQEVKAIKAEIYRENTDISYKDIWMEQLENAIKLGKITEEDARHLKLYRFSPARYRYYDSIDRHKRDENGGILSAEQSIRHALYEVNKMAYNYIYTAKVPGTDLYFPMTRGYRVNGTLYYENTFERKNNKTVYDEYGNRISHFKKWNNDNPVVDGVELTVPDEIRINHHPLAGKMYYEYGVGSVNAYVIAFILNTGYRFAEALSVKVKDITYDAENDQYYCSIKSQYRRLRERNEDGSIIYDDNGKSLMYETETTLKTESSYRTIPLNNGAMKAIYSAFNINGFSFKDNSCQDNLIFSTKGADGKYRQPSRQKVCSTLKSMAKNARIKDYNEITLHGLRHTVASITANREGDPMAAKTAQTIMGHKSIATTMDIYVKEDMGKVIDAVNVIDEI